MERRPQAFADAVAMDREPPVGSSLGHHMREAEEVERLRSALAPPLSRFGRVSAELDETGFLGVELQTELGEACPERIQTSLRLATVSIALKKPWMSASNIQFTCLSQIATVRASNA
jgi:hypothetical protein